VPASFKRQAIRRALRRRGCDSSCLASTTSTPISGGTIPRRRQATPRCRTVLSRRACRRICVMSHRYPSVPYAIGYRASSPHQHYRSASHDSPSRKCPSPRRQSCSSGRDVSVRSGSAPRVPAACRVWSASPTLVASVAETPIAQRRPGSAAWKMRNGCGSLPERERRFSCGDEDAQELWAKHSSSGNTGHSLHDVIVSLQPFRQRSSASSSRTGHPSGLHGYW